MYYNYRMFLHTPALMKCGIVGLPNVGKSTLFNALTATASAQAANFPFCTIEPNIGTVCVPDPRLQQLAKCAGSQTIIPTKLTFVDIAGLVRGASQGEGLGNQFLSHIRDVDVIIQVVRCFENDDIIHVAGKVDPLDDIKTIETELILADMQSVEKRLGKKKPDDMHPLLIKAQQTLDQGLFASNTSWTAAERPLLEHLNLLTLKPIIYVGNCDESLPGKRLEDILRDPCIARLHQHATQTQRPMLIVCNQLEAELASFDPQERQEYLATLGQPETGLDKIIRCAYDTLGLMTYFTAGPKEVRAWTVSQEATAWDAAGVIHTDFQKGFIRAEVVSFDDYVRLGSVAKAKEEGRWYSHGKEYKVQDGDVILFRFNV